MLVIFILSSLVHNFSPTLMKYRIFYETHYRKYLVQAAKYLQKYVLLVMF